MWSAWRGTSTLPTNSMPDVAAHILVVLVLWDVVMDERGLLYVMDPCREPLGDLVLSVHVPLQRVVRLEVGSEIDLLALL
eukprot:3365687-Pyramimonas_sp.AAC.1